MFETVVVATDGSGSVARAVDWALDLAARFEATAHAVYVVDERRIGALPDELHGDVETAMRAQGDAAFESVTAANDAREDPVALTTAVREGRPAVEIVQYARDVDADVVAMGTRGREGEHSYLLGSVAEAVVRTCPLPVLTVRQLEPA